MNIAKFTFPVWENENQLTIQNWVAIKKLIFSFKAQQQRPPYYYSRKILQHRFNTAIYDTESTTMWESLSRSLPNIPLPSPNPEDKCRTRPAVHRIIASQNTPNWKKPTRSIKSNSWLHTRPCKIQTMFLKVFWDLLELQKLSDHGSLPLGTCSSAQPPSQWRTFFYYPTWASTAIPQGFLGVSKYFQWFAWDKSEIPLCDTCRISFAEN